MRPTCKICLVSVGLVFLSLAGRSPAQAQMVPDAVCPLGYSVYESVCLDETSGDVVNQRPAKYGAAQSPPQCPPGSTVVNASCVDLETKGLDRLAGDLQ